MAQKRVNRWGRPLTRWSTLPHRCPFSSLLVSWRTDFLINLCLLEPGSTASSFLLTPGIYELRLGIQAAPITIPEECRTLPISLPSRSVMALEGGTPTAGNGDHRVGFQGSSSIFPRFPKGAACAALDEYSRWPHLRFRVIWHSVSSFSPFPVSIPRPRKYMNPNLVSLSFLTFNCFL